MSEIEQIFSKMPERYVPGVATKNLIYYFSIGEDKWTVFVDPDKCDAASRRCTGRCAC